MGQLGVEQCPPRLHGVKVRAFCAHPVSRASLATRCIGMSLQSWPSVEHNFGLEVEIVVILFL
jgi:hypothetical protein